MIDFSRIVCFDWDDAIRRKSSDKHEVGQTEAEQVYVDPRVLIVTDEKHGGQEARFHALGTTVAGRRLLVSFTLRTLGTLIRVISARDMSRKERTRYDQEV